MKNWKDLMKWVAYSFLALSIISAIFGLSCLCPENPAADFNWRGFLFLLVVALVLFVFFLIFKKILKKHGVDIMDIKDDSSKFGPDNPNPMDRLSNFLLRKKIDQ